MTDGARAARPALPPAVAALLDPAVYPHRPDTVELVQTHISFVFLAGDQVYKVKKPVRFAFLDFSTLERRRHFCAEEVRLNRALAGDVYRGVVAIRPRDGGFALAPEDAPDAVEYAVHMRRLPAERMLDALLERGEATPALIDAIAAKLVRFHAGADAGEQVRRGGDPAVIGELLERDFAEVDAFHGDTIAAGDDAAIRGFCRQFLAERTELLRRRQADGRIREGHGDLHTEHICCLDHLVIFDCIEFNAEFRRRDVAAEIAFLSMDLDYHRRPDLAAHLVRRYAELAQDDGLAALVPFYACQRAYIRGKVDSLKSAATEVGDAERAAARASAVAHFALAYRYTWSYRPRLVVIGGLSGSGKSSLAAAVASRTGFAHVNSDRTRKRLAGVSDTARPGSALYTPERSAATYAAMHQAAAETLAGGRGVILDATFQRRQHRDAVRAVARRAGVPIVFVECVAPEAQIRARLAERGERGDDASDADWDVYLRQRDAYEPFAPDEGERAVADTTRPCTEIVAAIEAAMAAA